MKILFVLFILLLHLHDTRALALLDVRVDYQSKENRVRFSKALLKEVEAIFDSIPNLSPEQSQWLADEEGRIGKLEGTPGSSAAAYQAQLNRLGSTEYMLRNAKQEFRNLITILRGMEAAENRNNALHAWVQLVDHMTDIRPFEHLEILIGRKVVTIPKSVEGSMLLKDSTANLLGRAVLRTIIGEGVRRLESGK